MDRLLFWISFTIGITCFQLGLPLEYAPSKIYTYEYKTDIVFKEPALGSVNKKEVGLKFHGMVTLTPVWNRNNKMLVKMELHDIRVQSASRPEQTAKMNALGNYPLLFEWEGSEISRVFVSEMDPVWSANVKVGIASLLQIQRDSGDREEIDVSGRCFASYLVDGDSITKTKTKCRNINSEVEFTNANPMLDVTVQSKVETKYHIEHDIIQSAISIDEHTSFVNLQKSLTSSVVSRQELIHKEAVSGAQKIQASSLIEAMEIVNVREKLKLYATKLTPIAEGKQCPESGCDSMAKVYVDTYQKNGTLDAQRVGSVETATSILHLIDAFRHSSQATLLDILNNKDNEEILPILIDAMGAAQTTAAQQALLSVLNFQKEEDITLEERYLLAVTFSTHPSIGLLTDLLDLAKQDIPDNRLKESVINTLGAVTNTYCRLGSQCSDQIVKTIETLLTDSLKACEDSVCKTMYLRSLSNAGLPSTLPILLDNAQRGKDSTVHEAAIKALRRIDRKYFDDTVLTALKDIFKQSWQGYDSSVRVQCLKLLLELPSSATDVHEYLEQSTDPTQQELDMFIQARLSIAAERDNDFSNKLKEAMKDESLGNYNILAPKGKSLAFKEFLADLPDVQSTYDMYVENGKSGIMKRSGMDVEIIQGDQNLQLYSFASFAAGLESLVGEEIEAGQEDVEATAGLALNLIDVSLRPVTFFTGQSELMSAVWNAPSELTSALQGNILMQDQFRHIALQNGFIVSQQVRGAISIDLSGQISISLWNKNCQSLIKNSGALVIQGGMGIHNSAFETGLDFTAEAGSVIDFMTDVDFYEDIKMCLQMMRPKSIYRHSVQMYEKGAGLKKTYRSNIRRKTNIQGVSYPLPKRNNELCREILRDS